MVRILLTNLLLSSLLAQWLWLSKTNDVGAAAGSEDVSTPSAVAGVRARLKTAATGQTISIEAVEIEGDMLFVAELPSLQGRCCVSMSIMAR